MKVTNCPGRSECKGDWHHQIEAVNENDKPVITCKHCEFVIPMHDQTTFIEESDGLNRYYFVCEGCGEEGLLGIELIERARMSCPSECGASYVQWIDPRQNAPALMCVVKPVFSEEVEL